MKFQFFLLIIFIIQMSLVGCAPFRDVGNRIGEDIGEVSDELGAERTIGEGEGAIVVHPQDDKKIRMSF